MRLSRCRATGLLFVLFSYAAPSMGQVSDLLTTQLKTVRGKLWLSATEYRNLQSEYLRWVDARVKGGATVAEINRELKAAGILLDWSSPTGALDESDRSHAGYLGEVSQRDIRGADDVFALTVGIYRGNGCSEDVTALIYQRKPLKRIAHINAASAESDYAYYLSGLALGENDVTGNRIVASGWVVANCTSAWNGKRIRIDALSESSTGNVVAEDIAAQDREPAENVAAWVQRDVVTFWYQGATGETALLSGPAIARYQIVGDHAVRQSPVALTRVGFIHAWLTMSETDAARWGEPEAVQRRRALASSIEKHVFKYQNIVRCGGSPPVWEVAVRFEEQNEPIVFRIGGSRATELRMLAISHSLTPSCQPEDVEMGMAGVAAELPW